ncbi:MAG: SH3 domain-containing protein [Devosia sp.]
MRHFRLPVLSAPSLAALPRFDPAIVLPHVKWAATAALALTVFWLSSAGALSLISTNAAATGQSAEERIVPAAIRSMGPTVEIKPVEVAPVETRVAAVPEQRALPVAKPKMMATLGLAVRARPEKGSAQVGALQQGEIVTVGSKNGGWILVTASDGESGWAYSKYLTLVDPNIAEDSPFWTGEN